MHILHTESSNGWGGQEIRILKESIGLRERGHDIIFAIVRGGKLIDHARKEGFTVYEIDFRRPAAFSALRNLLRIIRAHKIDIVNTHSSLDAWLGGIAARVGRCKVIRTRHLSTDVRGGLNAFLLYRGLADFVVTTSSGIIPKIAKLAGLPLARFQCIPTGVEPFQVDPKEVQEFREKLGVKPHDILIGTVCVVRSWKGIQDLIEAARLLKAHPHLKWVVVGGGYLDNFRHLVDETTPLTFTGHLDKPYAAIGALDIFTLLSTAHEGISQASLQAAYLKKPLITTTIGGLPEVCLDGITGLQVPPSSPEKVTEAVLRLASDARLREAYGEAAHKLVEDKFTLKHTLDQMEHVLLNC
ncbi:MAG TPA: glycosyltransferase family 4 protein [Rhabdochlamydiaceae bacterium]|jgi:glycosyltransferase involved in cell wall biosynthesis|nr:glycosyltransferase family 4 protein [Rhabdochlamydiaceae bacterium]